MNLHLATVLLQVVLCHCCLCGMMHFKTSGRSQANDCYVEKNHITNLQGLVGNRSGVGLKLWIKKDFYKKVQ